MKKSLFLILFLGINLSFLYAQGTYFTRKPLTVAELRKTLVGKPLADFNFEDVLGNKLQKKNLTGKVIVINLWFTTCGPCIREMPLLNKLVDAYKDTNVVFIAPALDSREEVERFLKKRTFNYQVVPDQQAYSVQLRVQSFPTHIIADKNGIIRQIEVGYNSSIKEILGQRIDALK